MTKLYFSDPDRLNALRAELAGWKGTRFWPRTAIKGVRADCIRFAVAVHQACGSIVRPVEWPRYSVRQWPGAYEAIVSRYLAQGNWKIETVPRRVMPGDVAIARLGDGSIHTGIIEDQTRAWHCFPGIGIAECHPANHHTVAIIRAYEHSD